VNGKPATGAWHWVSGTELHYREQGFWPSNSSITVSVGLHDVHLAAGVWGTGDRVVSFRTSRSFVMSINDASHQMTVFRDGAVIRTIPVSMGRPGYETRSGIKTIMSHERTVRMSSASYGGADYYDEIVHDAERLTNSGEYIHSAPWSVADQGFRNVSHGCVNVSPENAAWLFTSTLVGDPVVTTGTNRAMEPGNGTGADWDIPWSSWANGAGS
jgi:lipoprotein-anchoring transpeptidase ErfK/SrfK